MRRNGKYIPLIATDGLRSLIGRYLVTCINYLFMQIVYVRESEREIQEKNGTLIVSNMSLKSWLKKFVKLISNAIF